MKLVDLATACLHAYLETPPTSGKLYETYDCVTVYDHFNWHCYVAHSKDRTKFLVVYRGSNDWKDLWDSVRFSINQYTYNPVDYIYNDFPELADPSTDKVLCGHSWGGVLATLNARYLGCRCVTFGSPAIVEDGVYCDLIRVCHRRDPVPRIGWSPQGELTSLGSRGFPRFKYHSLHEYIKELT